MEIYIAPITDIDLIWPDYVRGIQVACERSGQEGFCAGELWQMCRSGFAYFVICEEYGKVQCVSIWRFEKPENATTFRCYALYGHNMRGWLQPLRNFIERIAKDNGATTLAASGRSKWLRLFKDAIQKDKDFILELK